MPYVIQGEPSTSKNIYTRQNFKYDYPDGLNLKPGSDFHEEIRNRIWERASESSHWMSNRFDSWNEIDRVLTTYITTDDEEKLIKQKDDRKPVSIIFPYTYSMLEALLTYMSLAFFQDPIFQYEGFDADDVKGTMLLEQLIRLHCIKTKVPLYLHTIFRDNFSYGIGIGLPGWTERYGKVPIKSTTVSQSPIGEYRDYQTNFVEDVIFEGNDLSNVDPYLYLPDPAVASNDVQSGEFVGWVDRDNYMNLLAEEQRNPNVFNVKYLRAKENKMTTLSTDQSARGDKYGDTGASIRKGMTGVTNRVDTIKMYVNLIPKEWELGKSEYPEKWFFALSGDDVVTSCYRANHNHGMYPVGVASSEFDGYSPTPMGRLEILYGLQGVLDFLFNSHVSNVRKSINDMLVVDPYLVNIKDVEDPKPGKLIRIRRPAWGHGVDKVIQQLKVDDITRANIADSMYITQWMDRISGADQSMQGALRQGGPERLTRSEFQGTRGSAVSRLQRLAMIIGMQFMQDIGEMFAVHTQQYMTRETYVRVMGRNQEQMLKDFGGASSVRVSPFDIHVNYDLIVRDGSIPGGNFSEAWVQMFQIIASNPELHQGFDVFRLFSYIAHQLGAKNIEDFKRVAGETQVSQVPDEEVINEVDKGNLVPFGAGQ